MTNVEMKVNINEQGDFVIQKIETTIISKEEGLNLILSGSNIQIPTDNKRHISGHGCQHRDLGNNFTLTADSKDSNLCVCLKCNSKFTLLDVDEEELEKIINGKSIYSIEDLIQSIITYYIDLPTEYLNTLIKLDLDNLNEIAKGRLKIYYDIALKNFKMHQKRREGETIDYLNNYPSQLEIIKINSLAENKYESSNNIIHERSHSNSFDKK